MNLERQFSKKATPYIYTNQDTIGHCKYTKHQKNNKEIEELETSCSIPEHEYQ